MDTSLYPLKFEPILKDKIWGGDRLKTILNKDISEANSCGESWEVSGLVDEESMYLPRRVERFSREGVSISE